MERTILHCDCNSFFASVETVGHPEYADVPMAVCGSREERHGIVLAKNEHAKRAGVKTGETIWMAQRKCPGLLIVSPTYGLYTQYSRAINSIYYEYTDKIEPFGLDESWLDVTGSADCIGDGRYIADALRARIRRELGITISVGVAFNKTFAKLGSDYKKPDATTVITRENYKSIVYPLPVSALLFAGRHTSDKLHMLGIDTIGQLAAADRGFLERSFGKTGGELHASAQGGYDGEVMTYGEVREPKSIGNGCTFKRDLFDYDDVRAAITVICDEVGQRVRAAGVRGKTVTVGIRDCNLAYSTRRHTLETPTCTSRRISEAAFAAVCELWKSKKPLRSITVTVSELYPNGNGEQLRLFPTDEELFEGKMEKLERTVDKIKSSSLHANIIHGVQLTM